MINQIVNLRVGNVGELVVVALSNDTTLEMSATMARWLAGKLIEAADRAEQEVIARAPGG